MLMYTSCGWFFDELSGIETVQVIQYAGRVIQLARETGNLDLEPEFLERLAPAKSNLPEFRRRRLHLQPAGSGLHSLTCAKWERILPSVQCSMATM